MRTLNLDTYLADIATRKAALGINVGPEAVDALRNAGARRTDLKREALRLAEERARAAGISAIPSRY